MRRSLHRPGHGQCHQRRKHGADENRRKHVRSVCSGVSRFLQNIPVDRSSERYRCRHQRSQQGKPFPGLSAEHPGNTCSGRGNGHPGSCRQTMAKQKTGEQRRYHRADSHHDQHISHRGQRDGEHEGGVHHGPAQAGKPDETRRAQQTGEKSPTSHPAKHCNQPQGIEGTAPESDLETTGCFQVTGHNTGHAPQKRHQHHERHGATMSHTGCRHVQERRRRASNRQTPAATETLRLSTVPCMGMLTSWSQVSRVRRRMPSPSAPSTQAWATGHSAV